MQRVEVGDPLDAEHHGLAGPVRALSIRELASFA
jgi:hypothetical protein